MARMTFTPADVQRSVDSTAVPAYATDARGRLVGWNRAAEITFGYTREEVMGRPCHAVVRGQDAFGNRVCRVDCPVKQRARSGGAIQRFGMYVRAGAGHYLPVECTAICLRGDDGDDTIIHLVPNDPGDSSRVSNPASDRQPASVDSARSLLTRREIEVLRLLAEGLSTRALADELSISVATVRSHVESVLQKLGVHSRLQAVIVASRKGLL